MNADPKRENTEAFCIPSKEERLLRIFPQHSIPMKAEAFTRKWVSSQTPLELFLTLAYQCILQRSPDRQGFQHHIHSLGKKALTRQDLLIDFQNSPESNQNKFTIKSRIIFKLKKKILWPIYNTLTRQKKSGSPI